MPNGYGFHSWRERYRREASSPGKGVSLVANR
jgi:hypothetical protein